MSRPLRQIETPHRQFDLLKQCVDIFSACFHIINYTVIKCIRFSGDVDRLQRVLSVVCVCFVRYCVLVVRETRVVPHVFNYIKDVRTLDEVFRSSTCSSSASLSK